MKRYDPASFNDAVLIDESIRSGLFPLRGTPYIHASRQPLRDVDFRPARQRKQGNLFGNECDGVCGV